MSQRVVTYWHRGRQYSFDVPGKTDVQARAHLRDAYHNGEIEEVLARAPVPGFFARFID